MRQKSDFNQQLILFDSEEEKKENPPSKSLYSYRYENDLNDEEEPIENLAGDEVFAPENENNTKKPKSVAAKGELSKVEFKLVYFYLFFNHLS